MKRRIMPRRILVGLRNPYLIVVSTLCASSFLFWPIFDIKQNSTSSGIIQLFDTDVKQFTIKTEGCEIPAMAPFDISIQEFVTSPNPEKCDEPSSTLLENNNTHIWIKKDIAQQYNDVITCCYRAFDRNQSVWIGSRKIDERVRYNDCRNFSNYVTVNDEFVRVTCYDSNEEVYDKFFLFAPKKKFMAHNYKKELQNNETGYNILVIGIDGVSRLNLYRTMPKTVKYLKNNSAVELMGYNKVGDNTFPNLIPMLLGVSVEELSRICLPHKKSTFDNCPFVWEWFKQAGYYTALGEDSSWLGTFNYLRGGFVGTPTDYYLHTFLSEVEKVMDKRKKKLCSNDKYLFQILLDYAEDLTRTLKSSKLFGFFWEITMSHDYLNHPAMMDDSYVSFLKILEDSKYLDDTLLFLVSDHGIRWGGIRSTKQGRLEERLPFVFILTPPSFRDKYSAAFANLKVNTERLTTPFDLHATLNDLVNLDNIDNKNIQLRSRVGYWSDRNISLFLAVPSNRTCQLAGIDDHWCTCHKDIPVSTESELVKEASECVIKYINEMLSAYEQCERLMVGKLVEAREFTSGSAESNEVGWREFLIVMQTRPGGGEYEATVRRYDGGQWALAGPVSRLNMYGNQSYCVQDNLLKLYCYCQTNLT